MAKAWPDLDLFSLAAASPARGVEPPPRTTLLSLLHLAHHCSGLTELHMTVDASIIPDIDGRYPSTLHHELSDWRVGNSLITSPLPVARFLSGLFPSLNWVCANEMQEGAHAPGVAESLTSLWEQASEMLPDCLGMRHEERMKAASACTCVKTIREGSEEIC
ncbi:hypothetical protein C8R46DRAFT_498036 [Mycena filopes]|nr:hypothetical protein C8R46DRAFT_498036 [Mycena filopes]